MPRSVKADRTLASRCVLRGRRRAKYAPTFAPAGIPTMDECGAHSAGRPSQGAMAWAPPENSYATDSRRTMPLPRGSPRGHRRVKPTKIESTKAGWTSSVRASAQSVLIGARRSRSQLHPATRFAPRCAFCDRVDEITNRNVEECRWHRFCGSQPDLTPRDASRRRVIGRGR
jgi:hypothetical protein